MTAGPPSRPGRPEASGARGVTLVRSARGAGARRGLALGIAVGVAMLGCATGWVQQGGRLVDLEGGRSIAIPEEGRWERIPVEGSALTLRREDGATLSWLQACAAEGEAVPESAQAAAKALLRSLGKKTVLREGPVEAARGEAWRVEAEVVEGTRVLSLTTVTRTDGRCTDDWVLVAPASVQVVGVLDRWWPTVDVPQVAADGPGDLSRSGTGAGEAP